MSHSAANELVAALISLVSTQNLRKRVIEGYQEWLQNSQCEGQNGLNGWTAIEIEPHLASCSLVLAHERLDYSFVDTRLQLCVRDQSGLYQQPIGYYRLITLLDGSEDDDYFVIDFPKPTGG